MGCDRCDYDSVVRLVSGSFFQLRDLNPHHSLLDYLVLRPEGYYFNREKIKDFNLRFSDESFNQQGEETPQIIVLRNYHRALEKAAKEAMCASGRLVES